MRDSKGRFVKGIIPWNKDKNYSYISKYDKILNKEVIINLYLNKQKGTKELAKIFKCSVGVIKRILLDNDIKIRKPGNINGKPLPRLSLGLKKAYKEGRIIAKKGKDSHLYGREPWNKIKLDKEEIRRLYLEEKKSKSEVAELLNISERPIKRILKESGIKLRTTSDQNKGRMTAWNKNLKGTHFSPKTEFKKGIVPWNLNKKLGSPPEELKIRRLKASRKAMNIKPNNPEKKMIKIIEENNLPFNYTGNGAIWFRGENHSFNPDFLSKNPKHIIEVFGDYWHNLPRYKDLDKRRIEALLKLR